MAQMRRTAWFVMLAVAMTACTVSSADARLGLHRSLLADATAQASSTAIATGTADSPAKADAKSAADALSTGEPTVAVVDATANAPPGESASADCAVFAKDEKKYKSCTATPAGPARQAYIALATATADAVAGGSSVSWADAPVCTNDSGPTWENSAVDDSSRYWGFEDGKSCAFRNADGSSMVYAAAGELWENVPACTTEPGAKWSVKDESGRYWNFENGAGCAYKNADGTPKYPAGGGEGVPAAGTPASDLTDAQVAAAAAASAAVSAKAAADAAAVALAAAEAAAGSGSSAEADASAAAAAKAKDDADAKASADAAAKATAADKVKAAAEADAKAQAAEPIPLTPAAEAKPAEPEPASGVSSVAKAEAKAVATASGN
ncbi:hypothetical protein FOA52_012415 [Chlamydomonas sp. UWO 241]|nr:hypothetical protein FOA52_012415 [Chlamydomonas sp. UWO 241]